MINTAELSTTQQVVVRDSSINDFIILTKPTVTALVVLSHITGMILAPGYIDPFTAIIAVIAVGLGSASSAVFNMWYDRDIDLLMSRTKTRPLVTKIIHHEDAIVFCAVLGVFALSLMAACVNYVSSAILLCAMIFYCLIYTVWLKRSSDMNIVIGGAAGSLPPIIGWLNVCKSLAWQPVVLFLIIFFWTPAHFWALAVYREQEYRLCKVPMLPITRGVQHTKTQIFIYTGITVACSLLYCFLQTCGIIYLISAIALGSWFIKIAYDFKSQHDNTKSIKLFLYSIFYLLSLLTSLIIDHYVLFPFT
jgi:protoheme IX farnesyltransferase